MRHSLTGVFVLLIITTSCRQSFHNYSETVDLSGPWKFQLDSANVGMKDQWFNSRFSNSIQLPGTTDENKKGI
jgi:hypothetical protein